jgi:hypothetical protein
MGLLFPLVILVSSVLIGMLLMHEGFVGMSKEAEFRKNTCEERSYGNHASASLSQGSLYKERRLNLQNDAPVSTEVPIVYGDTAAQSPPMEYSDPIAVQANPPPNYPFPTADMDTCESSCD